MYYLLSLSGYYRIVIAQIIKDFGHVLGTWVAIDICMIMNKPFKNIKTVDCDWRDSRPTTVTVTVPIDTPGAIKRIIKLCERLDAVTVHTFGKR